MRLPERPRALCDLRDLLVAVTNQLLELLQRLELQHLDEQVQGHLLAAQLRQEVAHRVLAPDEPAPHLPRHNVRVRIARAGGQPLYLLLQARVDDGAAAQGVVERVPQLRPVREVRVEVVGGAIA